MILRLTLVGATHEASAMIEAKSLVEIKDRVPEALDGMRDALVTAMEYQLFQDQGRKPS